MSQYIDIFIEREGIFIPLGSYSRGSSLYIETSEFLPYEQIRHLTGDELRSIASKISKGIEDNKKRIESCEKDKFAIGHFNNSLDEKLEALEEINQGILEWKEIIEESECARSTLEVLADIADNGNYCSPQVRIYAGIEISNPTKEDIIED